MRNRITEITLLFVMVLGLIGCGKNLSGVYISESGSYAVEFENDGTCTWYQGETFFEGTYKAKDKGYILEIRGNGLYSNTVFTAVKDNGDLIINGGTVNHERFSTKKSNNLSDEKPSTGELVIEDSIGQVIINNNDIKKAKAETLDFRFNDTTEYIIELELTDSGATKFGEYSIEASKKLETYFVYLDGNLINSSTIKTPITGGVLVLYGFSSYEEAKDHAKAINHYK